MLFRRDPDHFREQADLQKPGADSEINARGDQQQHQQGQPQTAAAGQGNGHQVAPEPIVYGGNKIHDGIHGISYFRLYLRFCPI